MEVANYFNKAAEAFDSLYGDEYGIRGRINRLLRKAIYQRALLTAREIEALGSPTVLDVGCGSGRNSVLFVKSGARHLTGIDFADRMLEMARAAADEHGVGSECSFIKGDFMEYDSAEPYDAVVALGVFDYVKDPLPFLRHMAAHSSGLVIGSFPGTEPVRMMQRKIRYGLRGCPLYFYSRKKLEQLAAETFEDFRILSCGSSSYLLVGQTS